MSWDPCRPTPWQVASVLDRWNGDHASLDPILKTNDIMIIPAKDTVDAIPRVELSPRVAMLNRRVFGVIIEIHESEKMLNTRTCYRFSIMAQVVYYREGEFKDESWLWCKTVAFSSNCLTTEPTTALLGSLVQGIVTPTFGTHLTAQMESWTLASWDDWHFSGLAGVPHPRNVDLDPGTGDLLPVLGGSGYDLQRLRYAISGVRLRPPEQDPHLFHRELASSSNAPTQTEGQHANLDPRSVDDIEYRKTAKKLYGQVQSREKRDESVLAAARRTHSRRVRHRDPSRGRQPHRSSRVEYTNVGRRSMAGQK